MEVICCKHSNFIRITWVVSGILIYPDIGAVAERGNYMRDGIGRARAAAAAHMRQNLITREFTTRSRERFWWCVSGHLSR